VASAPVTRRFDAVIFDLYGTLVPEFSRAEFFDTVRAAAERLGCDPEAFVDGWSRTAIERQTGGYAGGVAENLRAIIATLGGTEPSNAAVADALAPRAAMYGRRFHPRLGALETLRTLKERGYRIGLISMCAPDTPEMWRATPMAPLVDAAVFSSETGLRKPHAPIYRAACDRLRVRADACLYCGDGSYGELTGAEAVGMTAVEICDPEVDRTEQLRPEGEDWGGARVADLRELLSLLP
jgi:putative hydrolase of the HAD superfamily